MGVQSCILMLLPMLSGVIAQSDANFNCTFSECAGELLTCYCSVPSDILHWWGSNNISTTEYLFCIPIDHNQTNATRRPDLNVVAEVLDRTSSGGFTSRLVRQNISTELNNTVIGCSRSQNMDSICRPSSTDQNPNFSLAVTVCQAPNHPRDLSLVTAQDTQCNNTMRIVTLTWMAPEPLLSQFPVTNYSLSCTPSEGDSCNETLPADTTSYDLPVVAGVQYTITVSALSNDRESQNNPHLSFAIVEVLNVTVAESNATIQLQNDNFTFNFTITYGLCSGAFSTPISFKPPVVHLENLSANTTYCYSITYNGSDLVATACNGTFTTTDTETTPTTQPTTSDGPNIPVAVGVSISVVLLIVMTVAVACLVYHKDKLKEWCAQ